MDTSNQLKTLHLTTKKEAEMVLLIPFRGEVAIPMPLNRSLELPNIKEMTYLTMIQAYTGASRVIPPPKRP